MDLRTAAKEHFGYFLAFLVIFLNICCVEVISFPLIITLDRATEELLLIDLHYVSREIMKKEDLLWQYKSSSKEEWKNRTEIREHPKNPKAFSIEGLRQQTTYFIRVHIPRLGITSNELQAKTCPEKIPAIDKLRVGSVGPGWLDIRWTPPKEDCKSYFKYYVTYTAGNRPFPDTKVFGYIDYPGPFAGYHPHHPCENYPEEFCVLLTDRVQAGLKHTVKVNVDRSDSLSPLSTETYIEVVADYGTSESNPQLHGSISAFQCEEETTEYESKSLSNSITEQQVTLPVWVIIVVVNIILLILVSIVITTVVLSVYKKRKEVQNSPHRDNTSSAMQPIAMQEILVPLRE